MAYENEQLWKERAQHALSLLRPRARAVLQKLEPHINEFGNVRLTPLAETLQRLQIAETTLRNALKELNRKHIIRFISDSGFIQMNPSLWPPTAKPMSKAIDDWRYNLTEQERAAFAKRRERYQRRTTKQ